MSRRNRDYSGRPTQESYHQIFRDETGLGTRILISTVTFSLIAGVALVSERIGDAWAHRGDAKEYTEQGRRDAAEYGKLILDGRHATIVMLDGNDGTPRDIRPLDSEETGIRNQFATTLVNTARPGGQPSNELRATPARFDLEWDGYVGKNNADAPSKHCVDLDIPDGANGVAAWQVNGSRATLAIVKGDSINQPLAELCQYGKSNTGNHHEIAAMALIPGQN